MKKYYLVARNMWDEMLTYRLNFSVWRLRNLLQLITLYILWLAILPQGSTLGGYSQQRMLTYILGTALVGTIVFSTQTGNVGDDITNGNLSNFLLRPVRTFVFWFAKDIGDKAMNILFSLIELTIIFLIFHPPFFLQTNPLLLLATLVSLFLGILIYFYCSLLLGFIGFWSLETWAPRFIFMTVLNFFAGGLFPLDILPYPLFVIAQALPFTYMMFFPIKVYLGQVSFFVILQGIGISILWTTILYFITKFIWMRGLSLYTAQGR